MSISRKHKSKEFTMDFVKGTVSCENLHSSPCETRRINDCMSYMAKVRKSIGSRSSITKEIQ